MLLIRKNYETVVTATDVLDNWDEKKDDILALPNDRLNALIEKLKENCSNEKWTVDQAANVGALADAIPGEMMVSLWNAISSTQVLENIQKLHQLIGKKIVAAVQTSRNL